MKKILFIGFGEPFASSRYRAEQYYHKIKSNFQEDFFVDFYGIYPQKQGGYFFYPTLLFRKIFSIFKSRKFDVIFLQRNPVGFMSPFYENFIKYVLKKKIIFDFDDSLWILNGKYDKRIEKIIKLADIVIVGNKFLYDYAIRFNKKIFILHTVLDTDQCKPIKKNKDSITNICWIGSRPGNPYLIDIENVFIRLKEKYDNKINFFIISNEKPHFKFFDNYQYFDWSKNIEKIILNKSDVGIMPLTDSTISKGKCGFKIIQYGAYFLASVASPIGLNDDIIEEGMNGYLANNETEWISKLGYLIENRQILEKMKKNARERVSSRYSLHANLNYFVNIINSI